MAPRKHHAANLYVELGPIVYRCCLRILRDRDAAQDATQEVFLRLLRSPALLEDRDSVLPWIVRVARNHCINLRRDSRLDATFSRELTPGGSTNPDPSGALLARRVLERFDAETQQAALAVLASGMSYREAGAALELSPSTVARKVQRFVATSRTYLASEHLEARGLDASAASPERGQPAPRARAADWRAMLAASDKSAA